MAADRRELERDETPDHGSIQVAAFRRGQAKRLQRFPLIGRQVVVEFRVHAASIGSSMIRKSGNRFSEEIIPNQTDQTMIRSTLIESSPRVFSPPSYKA